MRPTLKVNVKLPKPQTLRQRFEHDCGVPVFAKLAGMTYEEVINDLPSAHLGITLDEWIGWLEKRGFTVLKRKGCPDDILPCAHLVAVIDHRDHCHWVYRDDDGDVFDPAPGVSFAADDSRMRTLSLFEMKISTISVSR